MAGMLIALIDLSFNKRKNVVNQNDQKNRTDDFSFSNIRFEYLKMRLNLISYQKLIGTTVKYNIYNTTKKQVVLKIAEPNLYGGEIIFYFKDGLEVEEKYMLLTKEQKEL